MKKLLLILGVCLVLIAGAVAQPITTERGKRSDEIFLKLRKIDLLNQLLPLLLTKDQINGGLLPAIERARAKQKQVLTDEDSQLEKLDAEVTEVLTKAVEKNQYPSQDFLKMIASKTKEMSDKRQVAMMTITGDLSKAVDATMTPSQKKIMENSFDAGFIEPGKKPDDIPAATKRMFFLNRVFLDPLCRELLIAIAEHAQ